MYGLQKVRKIITDAKETGVKKYIYIKKRKEKKKTADKKEAYRPCHNA